MNYEVAIVNPRTNEQRNVFVTLSADQVDAAKASPCEQSFVQRLASSEIPAGFLPIGNGVRPVTRSNRNDH